VATAGDSTGTAPVTVGKAHHVDNNNSHAQAHSLKEQESTERLTPRPTFMENLANSRDAQFHLDRRDSSELERYFVSGYCIKKYEACSWANIVSYCY
jgi:hypothetical protein